MGEDTIRDDCGQPNSLDVHVFPCAWPFIVSGPFIVLGPFREEIGRAFIDLSQWPSTTDVRQ